MNLTDALFAPSGSDSPKTKTCRRCRERKTLEHFHRSRPTSDGFAKYCKPCTSAIKRRHYYGITPEQYEARLNAQSGACAICGVLQTESRLPFAVDHDHACCPGRWSCGSCIRGLICDRCNRGIGLLGESPERLAAAAAYLLSRQEGLRSRPKRAGSPAPGWPELPLEGA